MTMEFTGYSDGDVDTNHTDLPTLNEIVSERYSRRAALRGGVSATLAAAFGSSLLAACGDDDGSGPTTQTLNAGDDVTVMPGTQLTLVGTAVGVTGANFTQTGGPALDLTTSGSNVTFTAPGVAQSTEFTFTLTGGGMSDAVVVTVLPATLNFTAIPKNKNDVVTVPAGYKVAVVTALGDPIASGVAAYRPRESPPTGTMAPTPISPNGSATMAMRCIISASTLQAPAMTGRARAACWSRTTKTSTSSISILRVPAPHRVRRARFSRKSKRMAFRSSNFWMPATATGPMFRAAASIAASPPSRPQSSTAPCGDRPSCKLLSRPQGPMDAGLSTTAPTVTPTGARC